MYVAMCQIEHICRTVLASGKVLNIIDKTKTHCMSLLFYFFVYLVWLGGAMVRALDL